MEKINSNRDNRFGLVVELSEHDFRREFNFNKGSSYNDYFSYDGLTVLYEYYSELSEWSQEYIFIDPIAIIGGWTEFENEQEVLKEYSIGSLDDLSSVLEIEGGGYLIPEQ